MTLHPPGAMAIHQGDSMEGAEPLMQPKFHHPLEEGTQSHRVADPCAMVIFGATGDLTARKLMPALYNLAREGQLPSHFALVAFARRQISTEAFREQMREAVATFSRVKDIDEALWHNFSSHIFYHQSNFDDPEGYVELQKKLRSIDNELGTRGNRIYYLSTQPSYFPVVVEQLHETGLVYDSRQEKERWSRVIIEKPFGHDEKSARALQAHVCKYLDEEQIFRIDHYLGKETVQNLLTFRFGNSIFESLWNNHHIENVQITCGEELGIGTRGRFFEEAGLLRDIVQNHVMQLLSLVAMEPPVNLDADSIRDEKVKVLKSLRPIPMSEFHEYCVRGQYAPGFIDGEPVKGYREEDNVDPNSFVETFAALKIHVDNWRWAGVPFYIRSGKRLPKRCTEIAVTFKAVPNILFYQNSRWSDTNVLSIRIQPDEGISLRMNCKVPGMNNTTQPVKMDFRHGAYFGAQPPEAYERLIADCIHGDSTLFARGDEVLCSWELLSPVLERWAEAAPADFPNYPAGTWGPRAADALLARAGHHWRVV